MSEAAVYLSCGNEVLWLLLICKAACKWKTSRSYIGEDVDSNSIA